MTIRTVLLDDREHWRMLAGLDGLPDRGVELVARAAAAGEALTLIQDAQPDVVLIDDFVPWTPEHPVGQYAVRVAMEVACRLDQAERPQLVLWSHRIDPRDAFAFCFYGGSIVCEKDADDPAAAAINAIERAARGEREAFVTPSPERPDLDADIRRDLIVVAALEEGMDNNQIATARAILRDAPADPDPAKARQRIANILNRLREGLGVSGRGARQELVQAARDAGYRWIRLEHAYLARELQRRYGADRLPYFVPPLRRGS